MKKNLILVSLLLTAATFTTVESAGRRSARLQARNQAAQALENPTEIAPIIAAPIVDQIDPAANNVAPVAAPAADVAPVIDPAANNPVVAPAPAAATKTWKEYASDKYSKTTTWMSENKTATAGIAAGTLVTAVVAYDLLQGKNSKIRQYLNLAKQS